MLSFLALAVFFFFDRELPLVQVIVLALFLWLLPDLKLIRSLLLWLGGVRHSRLIILIKLLDWVRSLVLTSLGLVGRLQQWWIIERRFLEIGNFLIGWRLRLVLLLERGLAELDRLLVAWLVYLLGRRVIIRLVVWLIEMIGALET